MIRNLLDVFEAVASFGPALPLIPAALLGSAYAALLLLLCFFAGLKVNRVLESLRRAVPGEESTQPVAAIYHSLVEAGIDVDRAQAVAERHGEGVSVYLGGRPKPDGEEATALRTASKSVASYNEFYLLAAVLLVPVYLFCLPGVVGKFATLAAALGQLMPFSMGARSKVELMCALALALFGGVFLLGAWYADRRLKRLTATLPNGHLDYYEDFTKTSLSDENREDVLLFGKCAVLVEAKLLELGVKKADVRSLSFLVSFSAMPARSQSLLFDFTTAEEHSPWLANDLKQEMEAETTPLEPGRAKSASVTQLP